MKEFRDSFYEELNKGLVGPGSDTFGVNEEEELISAYSPFKSVLLWNYLPRKIIRIKII